MRKIKVKTLSGTIYEMTVESNVKKFKFIYFTFNNK